MTTTVTTPGDLCARHRDHGGLLAVIATAILTLLVDAERRRRHGSDAGTGV